MRKLLAAAAVTALIALQRTTQRCQSPGKTAALCWAAWDPANALVELSKDFTKETGIDMKFEGSSPGRTTPIASSTNSIHMASSAT